jgi:hypothetical protein
MSLEPENPQPGGNSHANAPEEPIERRYLSAKVSRSTGHQLTPAEIEAAEAEAEAWARRVNSC